MSMEIRDVNPVGLMVLEHLKNHIDGLYKYFMKGKTIEESVGASLTKDIDKYCRRGYNLIWSDLLNRCMVDYNIIHILKTYVGYTHWKDVSNKQKLLCFRLFDDNLNLPDWDAEQEKYWAQILVTVHTECWSYHGQRIIELDIQKWKITHYIGKIGITIVMEVIIGIIRGWRT